VTLRIRLATSDRVGEPLQSHLAGVFAHRIVFSDTEPPPIREDHTEIPDFYPFIVIRSGPSDDGSRSNVLSWALGPDSPSIWFETYQADGTPGTLVQRPQPGNDYQIVARVDDLGSAPSYGLCIDYLAWSNTRHDGGNTIHEYSFVGNIRNGVVMEGSYIELRSGRWSPGGAGGFFPGDIIVRAYDPLLDHYTVIGLELHVTNDRHLAHRSIS